jgi:hypothetical protein
MVRLDNLSINYSGASLIDDVVVAQMTANFSGHEVYFNMTIVDLAAYNDNKEVIELDFDTFKDKALESINSVAL